MLEKTPELIKLSNMPASPIHWANALILKLLLLNDLENFLPNYAVAYTSMRNTSQVTQMQKKCWTTN